MTVLIDTHVWIFYVTQMYDKLSERALSVLKKAETLHISAIFVLGGSALLCLSSCNQKTAAPEPLEIEGMRNSVRFEDMLIGGQPDKVALEQLAKQGYRTVCSTRGVDELNWDEKAEVELLGMRYFSVPMPHPVTKITDEQVTAFDKMMQEAERPIVLHCGSGNRVSGLFAVWLVEHKYMAPEGALELATKAGMRGSRGVVEKRLKLDGGE